MLIYRFLLCSVIYGIFSEKQQEANECQTNM